MTTTMVECGERGVGKAALNVTQGEASIKPEFLVHDHVRTLNLDFVDNNDKRKLEKDGVDDESGEPPRAKLKGRNRQRPNKKGPWMSSEKRLCPSLVRGLQSCPLPSEKCVFLHDVEAFVKSKGPDIGDTCHNYDTFGVCRYGVSCRFASKHLTSDFKNVNEEIVAQNGIKSTTTNGLSKELQAKLRKHKYNFQLANGVVNALPEFLKSEHDRLKDNCDHSKDGDHWCSDVRCYLEQRQTIAPETDLMNSGVVDDMDVVKTRSSERKKIDFAGKLYLAPLTTVGNLPFRRICKRFGADITCGEVAMVKNLLQGQPSEWALLKRHESEDLFGVQLCGAHADQMTRCAQLLSESIDVDFVDINVGCPIDLVCRQGAGSGLMDRLRKFEDIVYGMRSVMTVPLTVKIRTGIHEKKNTAHLLVPKLRDWGIDLTTMHGRSKEQRYTKSANWDYIDECAKVADPMPFFGCGDVLSYDDYYQRLSETSVSGVMIARGALVKPWIFKEIKERRHLDITSGERMDILRDFVHYGLEHWGSDSQGVENTRKFLLEWLSFLYRYIPVGILERIPQKINERPPYYRCRDDLETLMASPYCADWIKLSEMLLGPVPTGFTFLPKHKANSYS